MKKTMLLLLAAPLLFGFEGCPSPASLPDAAPSPASSWDGNVPPPPGLPDAGDQADLVCAHLGLIGCSQPATCTATFRAHQLPPNAGLNTPSGVYTDLKPACLLSASSKAAAVSCGTVKCN
jgi:hypothetical protein